MYNIFRVWCNNKSKWVTDPVSLESDGSLLETDDMTPLNPLTHTLQFYTGHTLENNKKVYDGDVVLVRGTPFYGDYNTIVIRDKFGGYKLRDNMTLIRDSKSLICIIDVVGHVNDNCAREWKLKLDK